MSFFFIKEYNRHYNGTFHAVKQVIEVTICVFVTENEKVRHKQCSLCLKSFWCKGQIRVIPEDSHTATSEDIRHQSSVVHSDGEWLRCESTFMRSSYEALFFGQR